MPSEKCVTSRQNPLNRYMRNSRNLHHRDVLRRSCHNIKSVIISISTRPYPFAYSDCQAAALVSTRCDFMEKLCFNYTIVSTHKSQMLKLSTTTAKDVNLKDRMLRASPVPI